VGEECEETKLFVDSSELVVSKDSFFEGKDFFPVHSVVKVVPTCVKVRQDLVLDMSKSGSIGHNSTRPVQDQVQVQWQIVFNKSLLEIKIPQIELSPFQHARVARRNRGGKATTIQV
jgi:hypothetical protein